MLQEMCFIAVKVTLGCKRWFYARIKRGYFSKYDQTAPVNIGLLWYFTASSLILLHFSFNFIFKVKLTPHRNTFVLSFILILISVKTQCYHCLVITSLGVPLPHLSSSRHHVSRVWECDQYCIREENMELNQSIFHILLRDLLRRSMLKAEGAEKL